VSICDVRHQDKAIEILQLGLHSDRVAHGYIFSGPGGVGKALAAREFARTLLCPNRRTIEPPPGRRPASWYDSCSQCESCRLVTADTHPDYHLIYKELVTLIPGKERHKATELGIDVIRTELIERVGLQPGLGHGKVFIILEAHRLSRSAQNAMLKTLEEPPPGTYIILIAEQLGSLLPTTRSRAQVVQFVLLPDQFVDDRLTEAGAEPSQRRFFSRLVPGQLGLALELFTLGVYDLNERLGRDLAALDLTSSDDLAQWIVDQTKELAEKMQSLATQEVKGAPSESELTRAGLRRVLGLIGGFYHDALRRKLGLGESCIINVNHVRFIDELAHRQTVEQLQEKLGHLRDAQTFLDANVNQNLLLAGLLARLADRVREAQER